VSQIRNPKSEIRNWGLYLVTDGRQTRGRNLVAVVDQALRAGVRAVQLREKRLSARDLALTAEHLLPAVRGAGAALLINDRVDIALAVGADGVHLTRKSLPPAEARRLLGREKLIGISCHSAAEAREAAEAGADFVVLGPVYPTPSKASYGPPLGPEVLREARAVCAAPLIAIGGITAARAAEVLAAGADGVAVISAVLAADDPAAAARELLAAVAGGRRAN
jgi:thiamine-phosphate pyrophosphorylase